MLLHWVLIPQFKCKFLTNDARSKVELLISFLHLSWLILNVLGLV